MRGEAKIQGRRAVRDPFALRRRSCGCKGPAHAAGMQGIAAMKWPHSSLPPSPPAPPAMPRPGGADWRAGGKRTGASMPVIARFLCRPARSGNAHARHAGSAVRGPAAARAPGTAGALRPAAGPWRDVRGRARRARARGRGKLQGAPRCARSPGQKRPRAGAIGPARGRSRLVPLGLFMRDCVCRRGGSQHWGGGESARSCSAAGHVVHRPEAAARPSPPLLTTLCWPAQGRGAGAAAAAPLPPPPPRPPTQRPRGGADSGEPAVYRRALRPSALNASFLSSRASEYPGCILSALLRYLIALSGSPMSSSRRPMPAYAW